MKFKQMKTNTLLFTLFSITIAAMCIFFFVFLNTEKKTHETAIQKQQEIYEAEKQTLSSIIIVKNSEVSALQEKCSELELKAQEQAKETAFYRSKYSENKRIVSDMIETHDRASLTTNDYRLLINDCDSVIISLDNQLSTCYQFVDQKDTVIDLKNSIIETQHIMLANCERLNDDIIATYKKQIKKRNRCSFWTGFGIGASGSAVIASLFSFIKPSGAQK